MKKQNPLCNQEGFTLVEIIAVLIILGILAAVAVPRYIDLERNAREKGLDAAVAEMNGRESLVWASIKISDTVYSDAAIVANMVAGNFYDLGADYVWSATPPVSGTILTFQDVATRALTRTTSTTTSPASWQGPAGP